MHPIKGLFVMRILEEHLAGWSTFSMLEKHIHEDSCSCSLKNGQYRGQICRLNGSDIESRRTEWVKRLYLWL